MEPPDIVDFFESENHNFKVELKKKTYNLTAVFFLDFLFFILQKTDKSKPLDKNKQKVFINIEIENVT